MDWTPTYKFFKFKSGGMAVDETASERTIKMDHAIRHMADAFPSIRFLRLAAHSNVLLIILSEMDTAIMRTLKIYKPVPPPPEVISIDDTGSCCVGNFTAIETTVNDSSLMF